MMRPVAVSTVTTSYILARTAAMLHAGYFCRQRGVVCLSILDASVSPAQGPKFHNCPFSCERLQNITESLFLIFQSSDLQEECLQCFDTVGWAAGRASGL